MASAAVVPGAPTEAKPIPSKQSAILSPTAGVGAKDKSIIPNGILSIFDASWATNWPTRVILNAVFLIVSHNSPKSFPLHLLIAFLTTPGPLTPTLIIQSASLTPWKAPAINGLSSGALHNTTSLAHPIESSSFVISAVSLIIFPNIFTASIFIPVFVDPTLTELHTFCVTFIASGIDSINIFSAFVIPLDTIALYPPIKLTFNSWAHWSRVFAILTKSFGDLHAFAPTNPIGVIEIRLFTIGIPYFLSISSPVFTRSFATLVIFL